MSSMRTAARRVMVDEVSKVEQLSFDVIPACPESSLLKMKFNYDS
jgi:hypothetical protein